MKRLFFILFLLSNLASQAQNNQVLEYSYNVRGELKMIITGADTLMNFYDASGNRITRSQNIYDIPDDRDPRGDSFLLCYPNPSVDGVTVQFELEHPKEYLITLYDQNGRYLQEIAKAQGGSGKTELHFSLTAYPSGVYYIWFTSDGISKVKKIIRR